MASLYIQRSAVFYYTRFVVLWRVQTSFSLKFSIHCGRKWQQSTPTALQISKKKLVAISKKNSLPHSSLWSTKQEVGGSYFIAEVASWTYSLLDRLVSSSTTVIVISINQASVSDVQLRIHLFRFCRFKVFMCFYIEWFFFLVYVINLILKIKSEYEIFYIAAWIRQVDVISISQRKDPQKRGKWSIIYAIQLFTKFYQAAHHCFSCLCDKNWFFFTWIWAA